MLALVPSIILFMTALVLVVLRVARPAFRFSWLLGLGGALVAMLMVMLWRAELPPSVRVIGWQFASLSAASPAFRGDGLGWPLAMSLASLNVAILLTSSARGAFADPLSWAGTVFATGLALLAVAAANPLTLVLVWTALDLSEAIWQLRNVDTPAATERVVVALARRLLGSGLLVWASVLSGGTDFESLTPGAGLLLILAAGLRLGVLPLHVPYTHEATAQSGPGSTVRLAGAAASLVVLARTPIGTGGPLLTPLLLLLVTLAALYSAWLWFVAPDPYAGRPYWVMALAALAISAALRAEAQASIAWSTVMVLAGGALFLSSVQETWLDRILLINVWGLSALPFSLTAGAWLGPSDISTVFLPLLIAAQVLLMVGVVRQTLRSGNRGFLDQLPAWTRSVYPAGIGLLLLLEILLGLWGWGGAMQIGVLPASLGSLVLFGGLVWATRQSSFLRRVRTEWIDSASSKLNGLYRGVWSTYRSLGRMSETVSATLEGDGGVMWTLLFLVLFVSVMSQAVR
jgi:hypothetical protein